MWPYWYVEPTRRLPAKSWTGRKLTCRLNWFSFENVTSSSNTLKYSSSVFPNSAKAQFFLDYLLPVASEITIDIFTSDGVVVKSIPKSAKQEGVYRLTFNIAELGMKPGLYIVKMAGGNYSKAFKLTILP